MEKIGTASSISGLFNVTPQDLEGPLIRSIFIPSSSHRHSLLHQQQAWHALATGIFFKAKALHECLIPMHLEANSTNALGL